jgi:hypothetical protein
MLRTIAPVATASASAFGLTLIFYPTFVIGIIMFMLGLSMKLFAASHGIFLGLLFIILIGIIIVAFNEKLALLVPKNLRKTIVYPVIRRLVKIPLWVITIAAFGIPALAQLFANFSMIRMLIFVGVTRSFVSVIIFSVINIIVTILVNVLGVLSPAWLKPAKIVFVMQTFWVLQVLITNRGIPRTVSSTQQQMVQLWPFLSTTIMGWGSLILSSMPDDAVVNASRAAMQAALLTGGTAATAITIKNKVIATNHHHPSSSTAAVAAAVVAADGGGGAGSNNMPLLLEHSDSTMINNEDVRMITSTIGNIKPEDLSNALQWLVETSDVAFKSAKSGLTTLEEIHNQVGGGQDTTTITTTNNKATKTPLALSLLLNLNPPLWAAIPVTIIRAVPTVLVFIIAELVAVFHILAGHGIENALGVPLILLPFALAELFSVFQAIGIRRGFRAVLNATHTFETDGMQLLLWQSPKLLAAWIQFKQADEMLSGMGGNLLSLLFAPKRFLFPSEELIELAPELDGVILGKLLGSGVIDVIGVATFAIPVLGELFDILWAPVSGILINQIYGYPGFAFMGFAEEILPFTDVIPTASFTWAWIYLIYIPVWIIRAKRRIDKGEPPFRIVKGKGNNSKVSIEIEKDE